MNVIVFGIGMFGFSVLNHIGDNPDFEFFAYERDKDVSAILKKTNKHPYFFPEISLDSRIHIVDDYQDILPNMDIVLLIIPYQFLRDFIVEIKPYFKPGVIFVNLSKGINNKTFTTASDDIATALHDILYSYAVLSGGMIAKELIEGAPLGADIAMTHEKDREKLYNLFCRNNLHIDITIGNTKQVELAGALKNIFALLVGYYEAKGFGASTLGYKMVGLYNEITKVLPQLGWEGDLLFGSNATGGDIIATCFGDSRNRYFGKLVGTGMPSLDALNTLRNEKKIAEGYYTLQGLRHFLGSVQDFPILTFLLETFSQ